MGDWEVVFCWSVNSAKEQLYKNTFVGGAKTISWSEMMAFREILLIATSEIVPKVKRWYHFSLWVA